MKKRVNIYPTRPITNVTPIIRGVVKDVTKDDKTIRLCILAMAKVEEILKDGSVITLDLNNYNIDNNIQHPDASNEEPAPTIPIEEQPNNADDPVPVEPLDPNAKVPNAEEDEVVEETKEEVAESVVEETTNETIEEPAPAEVTEEVKEEVVESVVEETTNETIEEPAPAEPVTKDKTEEVAEVKDEKDDVNPSEIEAISKELDSISEDDIDPEDCEKGKDDEYGM